MAIVAPVLDGDLGPAIAGATRLVERRDRFRACEVRVGIGVALRRVREESKVVPS